MPRKPIILAAVIVALHLCEAATLGTTTAGSFLANLLEIFACGFAALMAFGASRRGRGLSRPFSLIVGAGIAMWGVANLGWMYYEVVLHTGPSTTCARRWPSTCKVSTRPQRGRCATFCGLRRFSFSHCGRRNGSRLLRRKLCHLCGERR